MARPARSVDFFRVWSPEMAYVLGYWWADGNMRIKTTTAHEIQIASNDVDHLVVMAGLIGEKYHLRRVATQVNTYAMTFCSKEMYNDILALGGTPRKSTTIGFPDIPAGLAVHFVRGVVDGDGTLTWNGDRPILQIYSGSQQLLSKLVAEVEQETGIPAPKVASISTRTTLNVKWSTTRAKCLAAWLYIDNPGVALQRKAVIAQQFVAWRPKRTPDQGTVTDEMRLKFQSYL